MSNTGQFFSEFIASTLLMFLIYALKDDGNIGAGNLTPLGLFFVIFDKFHPSSSINCIN